MPTTYLSGVVNPHLLPHAGRPELGVLIQPRTRQYVRHVPTFGGAWGLDNDCFNHGEGFDPRAEWWPLVLELARLGVTPPPSFVNAPDVVGDAAATWRTSAPWLGRIRRLGFPAALVFQDGIEATRIEWSAFDAVFIGGSDAWKSVNVGTTKAALSPTVCELIGEAKARGKYVHVGRVNGGSKYRSCSAAGADSCDGTFLARAGGPSGVARLLSWFN
jgi:hypothetical protein